MKNSILVTAALTSVMFAESIIADSESGQAEPRVDTEFDTSEFGILDGSGALENVDDALAVNPVPSWSQSWPDDHVIAPVIGRSPQLGWMLTGLAGYYMDLDKKNPDARQSIVGVFGMISENDSYVYGAGTALHLLEDKVRIKAGAGYGDINYTYYGTGNILNDIGLSVQIRQKMPIYFVSTTYRVLDSFYMGLGFLGGNVETGIDVRYTQPPPFADVSYDLNIAALEIPLQFDTRDHAMFPRNG